MIHKLGGKELVDIHDSLDNAYKRLIDKAEPFLGILSISFAINRISSVYSPVSANLCSLSYGYVDEIKEYMNGYAWKYSPIMGRRGFGKWRSNIVKKLKNPQIQLALIAPSLIESQMRVFADSPSRAQEFLESTLKPIVNAYPSPLIEDGERSFHPNAQIIVTLHPGQTPYVLVSHDKDTLQQWYSELEAATALILPSVVIEIEKNLDKRNKDFMMRALKEELTTWSRNYPELGEFRDWRWSPKLV